MSIDRSRFARLLPEEKLEGRKVLIVGLGGIGSYAAVLLAKMGVKDFTLIDPDKVDEENVATQWHSSERVCWSKVDAVETALYEVNGEISVVSDEAEFTSSDIGCADVVIAAVDSLEVRRQIVDAMPLEPRRLLVDPRMGLESFEVNYWEYPVEIGELPEWRRYYESLLATDALELPCGAKAIAYTGALCASVLCAQVRRWLCGFEVPMLTIGDVGAGAVESLWRDGEAYRGDKI